MSQVSTTPQTILVLESAATQCPELVELLRQHGEVRVAPTMAIALGELDKGTVSHFLATPQDLHIAAQHIAGNELADVLDTIAQGVCLMDEQGQILWSNTKFGQLPSEVVDRVQASVGHPYHLDGRELRIGVSIGMATSDGGYTDAIDVLRAADGEMYQAKFAGRRAQQ